MFMATPEADTFSPTTVPAPVGGLNAYDSLAAMPETDAIILQNWWPQPFGCSMRKGYREHSTGLGAQIDTIAGWFGLDGTQKLFAWAGASMFDVSSRAAVGAAIITGLSNALWETVTFTNTAGGNLIAVNGVDNGIIYKASGVARLVAGDGIVVNTWAGLNPANAVQVTVHQKRLWAVEKNSSKGWYLPPDAVQGTFVSFDFGPQFKRGGYLQFLTTWTLDDGNGAEDHLLALSSNGEAVVYSGTNPSSDTTWSLSGVYYIGSPVSSRRAYQKVGGDQYVLTQQGLVSMTSVLISTKVESAEVPIVSKKVQFALSEVTTLYGALAGWEVVYFPVANMLVINIPSSIASSISQFASNTITKGWCTFTGMSASAWCAHNNKLYYGNTLGTVYEAWYGNSDNILLNDTGGDGVTALVQQAYSYFGTPGTEKQVGIYRPTFVTRGEVAFASEIIYNYVEDTVVTTSSVPGLSSALWNTGLWGSGLWGGGSVVQKEWISARGLGIAASLKMATQSASQVLWISTDYTVVKTRGVL